MKVGFLGWIRLGGRVRQAGGKIGRLRQTDDTQTDRNSYRQTG